MLNNGVRKWLVKQECFSCCRKVEIDSEDWTWTGEEFQTADAHVDILFRSGIYFVGLLSIIESDIGGPKINPPHNWDNGDKTNTKTISVLF